MLLVCLFLIVHVLLSPSAPLLALDLRLCRRSWQVSFLRFLLSCSVIFAFFLCAMLICFNFLHCGCFVCGIRSSSSFWDAEVVRGRRVASQCCALYTFRDFMVIVQAWQSDVLDSEFLVDLVDARTEGPRFKTFVTYSLVSTLCPGGVRRRYSDFEWLRDLLKFRFHGASCCSALAWVAA
jgi:hypothetical protein